MEGFENPDIQMLISQEPGIAAKNGFELFRLKHNTTRTQNFAGDFTAPLRQGPQDPIVLRLV